MHNRLAGFAALVVLSVQTGCVTMQAYDGPARPASQVARVSPVHHLFTSGSILWYPAINSVNGEIHRWGETKCEVLPGENTIEAYAIDGRGPVPGSMQTHTFQALAGHSYHLDAAQVSSTAPVQIWIEDAQSKEVVAGTRPDR